ncbi:DUF1223 domain-containing protein [Methylorubrum suomiense]|uniref:DUF1223 domain-containing protein n=1 Tax=Methylorubrum suomiense TaxID=144191 RepID=A0ABQ4UXD0_9HYPH|nr:MULTISPECIES: DUF1223 domain-containing protein [Methylobacteriaceae]GJE76872.1 hypothetical protein BGCPKDLD_3472 [Methylorubrum suomiense]
MRGARAAVLAVAASLALLAPPAIAGPETAPPVRAVVEMFTSQGCSACLPADRLTGEFSREPGLLSLTVPVTYWDYLGWKDTLADHAFDERQRAYAVQNRLPQLATPQAVVSGRDLIPGSDRTRLSRLVAESGPLPVRVKVCERNERIVIDVEAQATAWPAEIWLVPVARSRPVAIGHGANEGRVAVYANVVRGFHRVGTWSGAATRLELSRAITHVNGADGYAVLLQTGGVSRAGRIIGAAKGPGL